jgi:hypothetical protein
MFEVQPKERQEMANDAKKAAPANKETAMGSALKDALAKSGGLKTVHTKPTSKKKEKPYKQTYEEGTAQSAEQTKAASAEPQKVKKGEAPDAKKAITTVARKIARKVSTKKPNAPGVAKPTNAPAPENKPAEKPYSPSVVKAYKEQLTHELKALIRKADDAGLLIHIPIVNGRPFVKFHDKATYKPKQPVKQEQQQKTA